MSRPFDSLGCESINLTTTVRTSRPFFFALDKNTHVRPGNNEDPDPDPDPDLEPSMPAVHVYVGSARIVVGIYVQCFCFERKLSWPRGGGNI